MRAVLQLQLSVQVKRADYQETFGTTAPTTGAAVLAGLADTGVRATMSKLLIKDLKDTPKMLQLGGDANWPELVHLMGRREGLNLAVRPGAGVGPAYAPQAVDRLVSRLSGWTQPSGPHGALWFDDNKPPGLDVVLHELGHASSLHGQDPWRKAVIRARMPGNMTAQLGQTVGLGSLLFPQLSHRKKEQLLNLASLSSLGMAPVLLDEYHASKHALDRLDQLHTNGRLGRHLQYPSETRGVASGNVMLQNVLDDYPTLRALARRRLLRAGGTYAVGAGLMASIPQVAKHIMHRRDQRLAPVRWWQDR